MENLEEVIIIYKCLKKPKDPRQLGKKCNWVDCIQDYAIHLKEIHPESCFRICRKTKGFKWQLSAARSDKGLIEFKSKSYIYEMYYDAREKGALYMSLTESAGRRTNFEFILHAPNLPNHKRQQTTTELPCLLTPIQQRPGIIIPGEILEEYCDPSHHLHFKCVFK